MSDVSPIQPLLSTADASYCTGVSVAGIRKWVQRNQLAVAARDSRGRPLFRWRDVVEAERSTRSGAGRDHLARIAAA